VKRGVGRLVPPLLVVPMSIHQRLVYLHTCRGHVLLLLVDADVTMLERDIGIGGVSGCQSHAGYWVKINDPRIVTISPSNSWTLVFWDQLLYSRSKKLVTLTLTMERPAWKNPTRAYCEQADNISGIFLAMTPHCALLLAATQSPPFCVTDVTCLYAVRTGGFFQAGLSRVSVKVTSLFNPRYKSWSPKTRVPLSQVIWQQTFCTCAY